MSAHRLWAAALAVLLCGASGCGESEKPAPSGPAAAATAAREAVVGTPIPSTERRALAERALSAQRVYAPAGDSAIEHFLQLREGGGADDAVETALLELLPYAVIGCEQAVARQDLAEAQRLLALIERVDSQFPAVVRLRAALAEADGALAQQALAAAETEKQRLLKVARDAELAAAAAAAATAVAQSAPVPPPASQAPQTVAASPALAPPTVAATAPVVAAALPPTAPPPAAAPAPDPAAATTSASASPSPIANATRALISAPPPRYPLSARRRKLEGDVTLTFTIQPDGSVVSPRVVAATTPGLFDEAAISAASRWRFETAAAPIQVTRQLRFRLESGS